MATHNYQPGYPLNLEPGSTDNERSLFQKIKAEFERVYRTINSGLSYIDQVAASIDDKIADFNNRANTLFNQLRQMMADLESRVNDMVANALANYYTKAQVDSKISSSISNIKTYPYRIHYQTFVVGGVQEQLTITLEMQVGGYWFGLSSFGYADHQNPLIFNNHTIKWTSFSTLQFDSTVIDTTWNNWSHYETL